MSTFAQEIGSKVAEGDLWSLRIPEVKLSGVTLEDSAKRIIQAFKASHPSETRLKGVVISLPEKADIRVTVDLTDVPVGLAFKYIADAAMCVVREREGIVTLAPLSAAGNKRAILAFEPSANVKSALKLDVATDSAKFNAALSRLGVNASVFERAEYIPPRNLVIVKGPDREIALLRSVIELIDRGASIELKR